MRHYLWFFTYCDNFYNRSKQGQTRISSSYMMEKFVLQYRNSEQTFALQNFCGLSKCQNDAKRITNCNSICVDLFDDGLLHFLRKIRLLLVPQGRKRRPFFQLLWEDKRETALYCMPQTLIHSAPNGLHYFNLAKDENEQHFHSILGSK